MRQTPRPERLLSPIDLVRAALGWVTFGVLQLADARLTPPVPAGTLVVALAVIVGVIIVGAFGVVQQAEALARRLGDPYGSVVLTLSIVLIEVILIVAVMTGPGHHATIGRDSVMAVSMIILNLVIGMSLVLGVRRHRSVRVNRRGSVAYLTMITALATIGFAAPRWVGTHGSYVGPLRIVVVVAAIAAYAVFLHRQLGLRADDFREVGAGGSSAVEGGTDVGDAPEGAATVRRVVADHRREVVIRVALLVATMIPIVVLSHDLASLLDDGIARLGAPTTLTGVLIAAIVFLPEGLTSVRAALGGELQRVSNLCHGALLSTLALTVPAVLVAGLVTDEAVVLAETPGNLALLAVTLVLSWWTFTARRITAAHGMAHLACFSLYVVSVFA
jgi:Ca2+:H+ antiporter